MSVLHTDRPNGGQQIQTDVFAVMMKCINLVVIRVERRGQLLFHHFEGMLTNWLG